MRGPGFEDLAGAGQPVMLLEALEILRRVVKAVGMVDPQAVDLTLGQPAQDQLMRRLENVLALHVQRRQIVDVEKAAVIDLVRSHPPVRQAVALLLEQFVEEIEASRDRRAGR